MKSILDNKFIFSNETRYRISRHLLFWFVYWIYFGFLHALSSFGGPEIMFFNNLPYTLTESFLHLLQHLLIAYPILYFILPRYFLKRKYTVGLILTALLWFLVGCYTLFAVQHIHQPILKFLMPERFAQIAQRPDNVKFFMAVMSVMKGSLLPATTTVAIKVMKYFFLKEHHNLLLQKENTQSQLQLLTAQVHPHFLFNTLNNIFSLTQKESPRGSKMIMGLSDLLRYILYEGRKPLVPLQQELEMISAYINLEKIRYGNKLDVHVEIPQHTEDLYIAPLLLLPFIENCFKHGASNMLQNPWINLSLELKEDRLLMKLMNGKASSGADTEQKGIGIANVQQRLNLLYKDKHELQITEDEEVFVIDLMLDLDRLENDEQLRIISRSKTRAEYV